METTPAQIDLWRAAPSEDQNLEFKEAKNNFDHEKLAAYCVAIANDEPLAEETVRAASHGVHGKQRPPKATAADSYLF